MLLVDAKRLVPTLGNLPVHDLAPRTKWNYLIPDDPETIANALPVKMPATNRLGGILGNVFGNSFNVRNTFRAFAKATDQWKTIEDQVNAFSEAVVECNAGEKLPPNIWNSRVEFAERLIEKGRKGIEVASQPPLKIYEEMDETLAEGRETVADLVLRHLRRLRDAEIAGQFVQTAPRIGYFTFYLWKMEERTDFERRSSTSSHIRDERGWTRTVTQELHKHEVVEMDFLPYGIYFGMPFRVKNLMRAIPEFLRDAVRVLYGDEIVHAVRSRVVAQQTGIEVTQTRIPQLPPRQTYRKDPAVLIGSTVLTGWEA